MPDSLQESIKYQNDKLTLINQDSNLSLRFNIISNIGITIEKGSNISNMPTQEVTPVRNNSVFFKEGKTKKQEIIHKSISPTKEISPRIQNVLCIGGFQNCSNTIKKKSR